MEVASLRSRTRIPKTATTRVREMTRKVARATADIAAFTALVSKIFGAVANATQEYEKGEPKE